MIDRKQEGLLRRIYPAENEPAVLRVEISPAGISAPPFSVRIVLSQVQAADPARRLRAVLDEL